ncbi:EpsG family protein [Candidatus Saccharibacteria bacterium]|nr:EpsG family protein [Candidatus Saccharibacteria bacterium]
METYALLVAVSLLIAFVVKKNKWFDKHKTLSMFIALLPLTVASALRFNVGWDYESYSRKYQEYNLYGEGALNFSEPGMNILIRGLSIFTQDWTILFVVFSVATAFFFSRCYAAYGKKEHLMQYILLFFVGRFYFCSLNIIRQALAMMIILYSLNFISKKKRRKEDYIKSIMYILLASTIHQFALIFLPLIFILPLNLRKKKDYIKFAALFTLVILAIGAIVNTTGYLKYFDLMFGNDGEIVVSELFISIAIILFYLISKRNVEDSEVFFKMEIIVFIVALLSAFLPTTDRIIWYFSIQNIFLIPRIIDAYKDIRLKLIVTSVLYVFMGVVVYNQAIRSDSYNVIPYDSVYSQGGPWERDDIIKKEHLLEDE